VPPRALEPSGVVLWDKPAGPSSFAIVAQLRRRTGARTGHTGTLDPFATGLLVLLSGRATRLAPRFVGLDKRYATAVDLRARTDSGDVTGAVVEEREPPAEDDLAAAVEALRGEVELPVPAASAVKIDGERAYRLHRRGVAVEMPTRRSRIHDVRLVAYDGAVADIELHVASGTYVRALADALGGHCAALRRTAVGPFLVEEADPERIIHPADALARLAATAA
jgi:tRNA pseudouridine55 synthase